MRCVVQPKGVELLAANSWSMSYSSGIILNEQSFRYEYDSRGLMIMKKVPGSSVVEMVYDSRDRLVMTRDGIMRDAENWMVFNMIVLTVKRRRFYGKTGMEEIITRLKHQRRSFIREG
ncbi:MAG: hypothetical protein WDO71_19500 [Bacteroidota bacterium]